ncbi:hypothetical protein [Pseudomonas oryzihabitans]|uniref:hypothetical protein n=1 Tax=Pseudomonas oryzihabitans TaxID=47885 RepID=UPI0005A90DAB|nr:hypothetical protein [Pseudomonas oryzihabitans]NMZ45660.1 hypothetical protein [Pseudomonas oryzihabitans]
MSVVSDVTHPGVRVGRWPFWLGGLVVGLLLLLALLWRLPDFRDGTGAQNLEASYHVLLSLNALDESGVTRHWWLPTVTLGGSHDKQVSWGATIPTHSGDYVYTSFSSYGFLAPYLGLKAAGLTPSLHSLALFNAALGALTALLLFRLLYLVLRSHGASRGLAATSAVLGCLIAVFSREALLSQGLLYWVQSFYQVLLLASLLTLFHYLRAPTGQRQRLGWLLAGLVCFGALTEWTGYVFGGGLVALFWLQRRQLPEGQRMAWRLAFATALAGLLVLLHYSLAAGLLPTLKAFARRFLARSPNNAHLTDFFAGYGLSFGLFLAAVAIALGVLVWKRKSLNWPRSTALLLVAASVPLLENLLLLQHATQFSFDRLKFIFPAALLLGLAFLALKTPGRAVLAVVLVAAALQNGQTYRQDLAGYAGWGAIDRQNQALVGLVKGQVALDCTLISTDMTVRGYANLLFHRSIHELQRQPLDYHGEPGACGGLYLEGRDFRVDLPEYTRARLSLADGRQLTYAKVEGDWRLQ